MAANAENGNDPLPVQVEVDSRTSRDQANDENEPYPVDELAPLEYFLSDEKVEEDGANTVDGIHFASSLGENEFFHSNSPSRPAGNLNYNAERQTHDHGTSVPRPGFPFADSHQVPVDPPVVAQNSVVPRKKPRRKRPRRNKSNSSNEAAVSEYIDEPTETDVLMGRGGRSNHHKGNQRYRNEVRKLQDRYFRATKTEKTVISNSLVKIVQDYGGRFLKKKKSIGKWYVVRDIVARRKASQALRERQVVEDDDHVESSEASAESIVQL